MLNIVKYDAKDLPEGCPATRNHLLLHAVQAIEEITSCPADEEDYNKAECDYEQIAHNLGIALHIVEVLKEQG